MIAPPFIRGPGFKTPAPGVLLQRDCGLCGFFRYRSAASFYCVGYQAHLAVQSRACHFFTFGQPDADRVQEVQRLLRPLLDLPELVPETEGGKTLLISRVLREMEAAKSARVLPLSTTALITSGAKSQFETFSAKNDDLSTGGVCP